MSARVNPIDAWIGSKIRERRLLLGLSQSELAAAIGITFQQVQKYEHGFNRVSASRLFEIALVLQADITWFFDAIPDSMQSMSPRKLVGASKLKMDKLLEDLGVELNADPLAQRQTLELVRAFRSIENPRTRAALRAMIFAAADSSQLSKSPSPKRRNRRRQKAAAIQATERVSRHK